MKVWPKTGTVYFCDLMNPLMEFYRSKMKSPKKDFTYNGYEVGSSTLCSTFGIYEYDEYFKKEMQEGRDIHEVFMTAAFQLGLSKVRD